MAMYGISRQMPDGPPVMDKEREAFTLKPPGITIKAFLAFAPMIQGSLQLLWRNFAKRRHPRANTISLALTIIKLDIP